MHGYKTNSFRINHMMCQLSVFAQIFSGRWQHNPSLRIRLACRNLGPLATRNSRKKMS